MREVRDAAEILEIVRGLKTGAAATNLFLSESEIASLANDHKLRAIANEQVVYLLKSENGFTRLYFRAESAETIAHTLGEARSAIEGDTVTDLIGLPAQIATLRESFFTAGFREYKKFERMSSTKIILPAAKPDSPTFRIATAAEAATILRLIQDQFDARAEHIPSITELQAAIAKGTVLVVDSSGTLTSLLYFDRTGVSTTLRYWLVRHEFRGKGFGDVLLNEYLRLCSDCKRFLLWVECGNSPAIRQYSLRGYRADGVVDQILVG